ncbi:hypothetical protein A0H81_14924 [Grifola frondosa]|uniref:Uncharacterized protein n=1 Tax=Grifola frondosa TaxID=5627 RepID=A0A1C7LMC2_GRIFR|nr:hypothetical protein A0H81_14924 [Grifola frondosa]
MTSKQPSSNSRFAPYKYALDALAARTRTPLPSLILSFAILHELTAMIPLVGLFFSARALGIGERFIEAVGVPVGVGHKTDSDNPVLPSGLSSRFQGAGGREVP